MPLNVFELFASIGLKSDEFNKGIDAATGKGESFGSKFGSVVAGVGKAAAVGLGVAATAFAGLSVKALQLGGDLEQNLGGSEAVFGKWAGHIQDTADSAFETMGLSMTDFLGTANKMGALFKGAGFGIEDSAKMSADAMQRAADVASIMGIDTVAAMEAVAGAAKGNFTMMDNLGIAMNDTAINAYALEKGLLSTGGSMQILQVNEKAVASAQDNLKKTTLSLNTAQEKHNAIISKYGANSSEAIQSSRNLEKAQISLSAAQRKLDEASAGTTKTIKGQKEELTQQQKIQIAMEMFLDKSAYAAGNYAKENETLAGSLATAKAALSNFLSGAGNADDFVDAFSNVANVVVDRLDELLPRLTEGITGILANLIPKLPPLIGRLLPAVITGAVSLFNGIVSAAPEFVRILAGLLPMALQAGVDILLSIVNGIATALPTLIPMAVRTIMTLINTLTENLPLIIKAGMDLLQGIITGIIDSIPILVEMLPKIIESIVSYLTEQFPVLLQAGVELFTSLIADLPTIIKTILDVLPELISSLITALLDNIPVIIDAGIELLVSLVDELPQIIDTIVEALPSIITSIINALMKSLPKLINAGVKLFVALVTNLPTIVIEIVKAIPEIIKAIVKGFVDAAPQMAETGLNLIKGLWNGIKDAGKWLLDKVSGFVDGIIGGIKGFFGIKSPSKVFAEMGKMNMQGLAKGFMDSVGFVKKRIATAMSGVMGELDNTYDIGVNFSSNSNLGTSAIAGGVSPLSASGNTVINQYIQSVPQTASEQASATVAAFQTARWVMA